MSENPFKIEKQRVPVQLELSNGDTVCGTIFLHYAKNEYGRPEEPLELLNSRSPFFPVSDESEAVSFYNKAMVLCLTYQEDRGQATPVEANLNKQVVVTLYDDRRLTGMVQALLPPEHARLYDFLNLDGEAFMKIAGTDGTVSLINKAYVAVVNPA